MKRKRSKRNRVAQGAAGTRTCGSDRMDAWWHLLSHEIAEASKRFWSATPERRAIEAKRKRNEF